MESSWPTRPGRPVNKNLLSAVAGAADDPVTWQRRRQAAKLGEHDTLTERRRRQGSNFGIATLQVGQIWRRAFTEFIISDTLPVVCESGIEKLSDGRAPPLMCSILLQRGSVGRSRLEEQDGAWVCGLRQLGAGQTRGV